jgi:hypothetical protein
MFHFDDFSRALDLSQLPSLQDHDEGGHGH